MPGMLLSLMLAGVAGAAPAVGKVPVVAGTVDPVPGPAKVEAASAGAPAVVGEGPVEALAAATPVSPDGALVVPVDGAHAADVSIELVRDGNPTHRATAREGAETADERVARSHSDFERMAVAIVVRKGLFVGTHPRSVRVDVYEDSQATALVSATTYTITPALDTDLSLVHLDFSALWESATKKDPHDTSETRRELLVRVSSIDAEGRAGLVRERLLTVVYNPTIVPSAVTHTSLFTASAASGGAWTADFVSFAPAALHVRLTPITRTAWLGVAADLAVLDTSLLSTTTTSEDAAAPEPLADSVTISPEVMPARLTVGLDVTYNHGFFDGKSLYLYGGLGLGVTEDQVVHPRAILGASLVVPFDFSGKD